MKTRIISGAVLVVVFAAVLAASIKYSAVMYVAAAVLAAIAVYEALYATGIVKNKIITAVGCVYSIFYVCKILLAYVDGAIAVKIMASAAPIAVVFALIQFALYLKFHKDIKLEGMLGMIILPILISFGFESLSKLVLANQKLLYIVLMFCWAAVADTGAYFVGVAIGKHKMAPIISPKKSWEGLIGGILSSVLVSFIVCLIYSNCLDVKVNTLAVLLVTPIFVLIGVMGDLTASLIKRKCGIKDFGKLIPGHGGVLDRFDSMLMISAALISLLEVVSLIN
ncbi:MAG: phosphatidate cytidylyltransferase [Clostridia bacterium]|nr:phosphatidate cytidylyltransferase [Clostridia bacterium]